MTIISPSPQIVRILALFAAIWRRSRNTGHPSLGTHAEYVIEEADEYARWLRKGP
jgi:hypothetical protein